MIMGILISILPLLLQILGVILQKTSENKIATQKFIELVSALEHGGMKSVRLNKSYREQIEEHKAKAEKA